LVHSTRMSAPQSSSLGRPVLGCHFLRCSLHRLFLGRRRLQELLQVHRADDTTVPEPGCLEQLCRRSLGRVEPIPEQEAAKKRGPKKQKRKRKIKGLQRRTRDEKKTEKVVARMREDKVPQGGRKRGEGHSVDPCKLAALPCNCILTILKYSLTS